MTKLTLSADEKIIAIAKKQARQDGISVSAMFSNFIRARFTYKNGKKITVGPLTARASAIGKLASKNKLKTSDKELIENALTEKYGIVS